MHVLVLAGEGPYFKNSSYLDGTFFDRHGAPALEQDYARTPVGPLRLDALRFDDAAGASRPLLRSKRGLMPHLTSFALNSILRATDAEYELFRLERVWDGDGAPTIEPDVVFLSTTFICERHTLRRAIAWCAERYPDSRLVLGGQYSSLKYAEVLERHPEVDVIVRGDGEDAIPILLGALAGKRAFTDVPNLAVRDDAGTVRTTRFGYVDLEAYPSPSLDGAARIVPYESMRGCPFRCRFCSFPAASPQWRYKSAEKIAGDWARYADENGAEHIRAMDSTFTVPYARLRGLLDRLDGIDVTWEAYSRANNLKGPELVDRLASAGCTKLSIGFESMSDATLGAMNKLVTSADNRCAFELLRDSAVSYRISVMVGYPGETPEDYEQTHRFLVDEFAGHYMLSVFSFLDETMPVWNDAERFGLRILDSENPDYGWTHSGMDADTATALQRRTLDETRLHSEQATVLLWQTEYETPLVPHLPRTANMRLEKLVERLGMAPRDHPAAVAAAPAVVDILNELKSYGITREEVACSTA
jgi:anaerobic magnesium-protoporphyrin IX monomethyl ester cyclase